MHWLYDVPDWALGILVVGATVALTVVLFIWTRRWRHAGTRFSNDAAGAVLNAVTLTYGIILALIAVASWDNYRAADTATEHEAAALLDLHRKVQGYPDPERPRFEARLRTYINSLLTDEWPALRRDEMSERTMHALDSLVHEWTVFAPDSRREALLQTSTLNSMDALLTARRERLAAGTAGLPGPLWVVVLVGAVITIGSMHVLRMENEGAHLLLTVSTAVMLGLVIFVIVVLDHPLWGTQGLGAEPIADVSRIIIGGAGH